jgi:hypothetical protein
MTQPNPGYIQLNTTEIHQLMDELAVCPDLTEPWILSVNPKEIHQSMDEPVFALT